MKSVVEMLTRIVINKIKIKNVLRKKKTTLSVKKQKLYYDKVQKIYKRKKKPNALT